MEPAMKYDLNSGGNPRRVVVAMSGGVDSSVAALLLRREGHDVVGISMQVWDYRQNGGCSRRATCCAPDDFTDARKVAAAIGVPYYVFDFEENFRAEVIDRFVQSYAAGLTPNPCVDCNSRVKFHELRQRAAKFGYGAVATGHYARIDRVGERYRLLRGQDAAKDQSYFLYGMTQTELANTLFPVGHLTKPEVRELARAAGLATAAKRESQDICFVSGSVKDFLVQLGVPQRRGEIVALDGRVLAEHDGVQNFTIGQRRGLGVGGREEPYYVVALEPESNRVIVGERADLEQQDFTVSELSWVDPRLTMLPAGHEFDAIAQIRSRHPGVPVRVRIGESGAATVSFRGDWAPVAPGQAAVFYTLDNSEVLGGGRIAAAAVIKAAAGAGNAITRIDA